MDMDAELGGRLEALRQEKVVQVFQKKQPIAKENVIKEVMAVSVEVQRRADDLKKMHVVFLADGANWIWDRFVEIASQNSTFIGNPHSGQGKSSSFSTN